MPATATQRTRTSGRHARATDAPTSPGVASPPLAFCSRVRARVYARARGSVRGRKQILDLYSKPMPLDDEVDLDRIARSTPGMSGADLSNLMNVAALRASHEDKKKVGMSDLEYACDKIRMGAERKSAVISPENLKLTAYHEGGHALVVRRRPPRLHACALRPRPSAFPSPLTAPAPLL